MRTGRFLMLGTLAAATVLLGGYGLHAVRSAAVQRTACDRVEDHADRTGPVQRIGGGPGVISVLGDSYSSGDELEDRRDAWTFRLAADVPAQIDVVAQGGTGYLEAGFCGDGTFAARAHDVPDDGSLLIVEGGLNDIGRDSSSVRRAAGQLLALFPDREVVVIGPVDAPATTGEGAVDRDLRAVAQQHGARYLSALDWSDISFGPDRKHMSPAGHAAYAERVAAALGR